MREPWAPANPLTSARQSKRRLTLGALVDLMGWLGFGRHGRVEPLDSLLDHRRPTLPGNQRRCGLKIAASILAMRCKRISAECWIRINIPSRLTL